MNTLTITPAQWAEYETNGYLKLGKLLDDSGVEVLRQRIDDIMLGRAEIDYDRIMMQLDSSSGAYGDAGPQSLGHKGATLDYRKIEWLEFDPLFLAYVQRPEFRDICARVYGPNKTIRCFRAMFMNKPANKGTLLPWHQDRWVHLDRDPLLTVWTALDPATVANGCVQVIPGSHKLGVINPDHPSGFLTDEQIAAHCSNERAVYLELAAGEVALLHNWLLHRSDKNHSNISRRAFSVNYMDADTRLVPSHIRPSIPEYTLVFGPGALQPEDLAAKV